MSEAEQFICYHEGLIQIVLLYLKIQPAIVNYTRHPIDIVICTTFTILCPLKPFPTFKKRVLHQAYEILIACKTEPLK